MVKKNADGSIEISFRLSKAQVQYLGETPAEIMRLDCGGERINAHVDQRGGLWLSISWDSIVNREALHCGSGTGCGIESSNRGAALPSETAEELGNQIEQYRSGMGTPPEIRESIVMCFRNGCVAAYIEQDDGTYKVSISGDMYPRHLKLINQVIDLFKECSKEDRPAKSKPKEVRRSDPENDQEEV